MNIEIDQVVQSKMQKIDAFARLVLSDPADAIKSGIYNLYSVRYFSGKLAELQFDASSPIINLLPHYTEDDNFRIYESVGYIILIDKE